MTDTSFTDSYVLTDAILEAYLGANPKAAAIALKALAVASQEWYCREATRIIDALPLQGYKLLSSQDRQFPRKYAPSYPLSWSPWGSMVTEDAYGYIYMSSSVPQDVIDACCDEAVSLYVFYSDADKLERQDLIDAGVQSTSLGGQISETFGSSRIDRYHGLHSKKAYQLLEKYIENSVCVR